MTAHLARVFKPSLLHRVINMLVGNTQRITVHAERGFAIPQDIPDNVQAAGVVCSIHHPGTPSTLTDAVLIIRANGPRIALSAAR